MSRIFIVMGKSATGKDTIFKELVLQNKFPLKTVVPYTTRPIRTGETEGEQYHFVSSVEMYTLEKQGKIIEKRVYQTVLGEWCYFTVDDGQIDLNKDNYIMISTLEGYSKLRNYFGTDKVVPIYVEVEDGERLNRALSRERMQANPKYEELCRRFLADQEDFEESKIQELGIKKRYYNQEVNHCVNDILSDICKLV